MGDHGKPYRTCTWDMRKRMLELVRVADIITPNLTEACMLLGQDHIFSSLTVSQAKSLLARLGELGPDQIVVTGVELAGGVFSNIGYDRKRPAFWRVDCQYVPVSYPGTGDLYAAILVGGLLKGDSLPIAMDRATRFAELCIKTTFSYGSDTRHGVMLEKSLHWLVQDSVFKEYKSL